MKLPQKTTRRTAIRLGAGAVLAALSPGCRRDSAVSQPNHPDSSESEIIIAGGTVVAESGTQICDIRVRGERIAEVGRSLVPGSSKSQTISASDLLVLPGGIDPHVHLSKPWCDDFNSGSKAALAGGITTLGHMSFPARGQSLLQKYTEDKAAVEEKGICDFFFHLVATDPARIDQQSIQHLVSIGQPSIKLFMLTEQFESAQMQVSDLMRTARELGVTCAIHAEDQVTLQRAADRLTAEGRTSLEYYPGSRPVDAEIAAVRKAIALCAVTGASIYLVHISSGEAIRLAKDARRQGLPVFLETRPMYLHLTDEIYEREDAPLFVGMPPVRTQFDREALWDGLRNGAISTVATDHAAWTRDEKMDPALTINNPRGGVNNLQVMLPMLMHEVAQERLELERFVDVTSTNAAKIFGLYPYKGVIAEGSYADIVIWDPEETRTITDEGYSNAGFSIYSGTSVQGWPVTTLRRGEVVFENEEVTARSGGKVVARTIRQT
ncbi:MAG: amidohydrolase family protein [Planctomycetota bacterium]